MSKMGHFRRFFMSAECPVKGVISKDAGSLLMMSSAAQFRLPTSRDESCGTNQAIINGMFDAPEQAAGGEGTRGCIQPLSMAWRSGFGIRCAFPPETNATRTRASTRSSSPRLQCCNSVIEAPFTSIGVVTISSTSSM